MNPQHKNTKKQQDEIDYRELRDYKPRLVKTAYYLAWVLGLLVIGIGIYLCATDTSASGTLLAGRFSSSGQQNTVTGPGAIFFGILLIACSFLFKDKNSSPE